MAYRAVDMNDKFAISNISNVVRAPTDYVFSDEEKRQHAELLQRYDLYQGLYGDIHPTPVEGETADPRDPYMICDLKMLPTIGYTYSEMLAEVIDRIDRCGGIIFGGFIRDNFNSLKKGLPIGHKDFKDIDVWITNQEIGIQILDNLLEMKLIAFQTSRNSYDTRSMSFKIVHPVDKHTTLIMMDMVVSDHFPTRDVDINCLGWENDQLKSYQNPEIEYVPDVDSLCQKILDKTGTALRHTEDPGDQFKSYLSRYRHMVEKGFTIEYDLGGVRVQINDLPQRRDLWISRPRNLCQGRRSDFCQTTWIES